MATRKKKKENEVLEEKPTEEVEKKPETEKVEVIKPDEMEIKLSIPSLNLILVAILFFAIGFFMADAMNVDIIGGGSNVTTTTTTTTIPTTTTTLSSEPLSLIVINDVNCPDCDTYSAIMTSQQLFPGVEISEFDLNTTEGQQLVQRYGIELLPAYLFGENLPEQDTYGEVAHFFDKVEDKYILKPESTGSSWYVDPEERRKAEEERMRRIGEAKECLANKSLSPDTVIFLHSNSCGYCAQMKPIVTKLQNESYKFHWAETTTDEGMEPVRDCLSEFVSGSIPEFFCVGTVEKTTGAMPEEDLRALADRCRD
jgi:hypothetical protein